MNIPQLLMVARMFGRMLGRVPAGHLYYLLRRMRFEKPHRFAGQVRINTFFPPYPSRAFERFCEAVVARRRVPYSTYLAVTGECPYRCGHCSYAARPQTHPTTAQLLAVIEQVKSVGTCTLGLTGGEPLLREDLHELIAAAEPEMVSVVFTTGYRLDVRRARQLANAGIGCVTVGLEAATADKHDSVRGRQGSFAEAEAAVRACHEAGTYVAVSTIATRAKLATSELQELYDLARRWGVGEFRILAPVATGAWRGQMREMLNATETRTLARFHEQHNRLPEGPAVAAFAYLESDGLFGCGAGFHHLFIDAAGNVCPCDLTPLSFGNVTDEPLIAIWNRMREYFPVPRRGCLMRNVAEHLTHCGDILPLERSASERLSQANPPDGSLPGAYSRLLRLGQVFINPK